MTGPAPGRAALVLVTAAVVLCAAAAWGYLALDDARDAAAAAAADLAASRQAAARIVALRGKAPPAPPTGKAADLRKRINEAAEAADIDAEELGSISEQPPRQVGTTAFQERPTQVQFRQVTLEQLVTFLHTVCDKYPGLRVTTVQLSSGPNLLKGSAATAGEWSAEATLSYQVLVPPTSPGGRPPDRLTGVGE